VGVVVGSLVKRDGKYLLVKENPNGKDVYNLPAGHVDNNTHSLYRHDRLVSCKHLYLLVKENPNGKNVAISYDIFIDDFCVGIFIALK
jgi:hypothetical protein